MLLVSPDQNAFVCSTKDGCLKAAAELECGGQIRWLSSPLLHDKVLAFGPSRVHTYRWESPSTACAIPYHDINGAKRRTGPLDTTASPDPDLREGLGSLSLGDSEEGSPMTSVSDVMITQDRQPWR